MMHDLGLKATHKLTQQKGACQVLQINSSAGKVHDRPWKSKLARIRASGSFQKSRASPKNQSIEASSEKCIFNGPTNTIRNSSPLCTAVHSCPAASPWTNTLRKVRPGTSTFASITQGVVAIWHRKRFVCIFQDDRSKLHVSRLTATVLMPPLCPRHLDKRLAHPNHPNVPSPWAKVGCKRHSVMIHHWYIHQAVG